LDATTGALADTRGTAVDVLIKDFIADILGAAVGIDQKGKLAIGALSSGTEEGEGFTPRVVSGVKCRSPKLQHVWPRCHG
jgi:hypothetical protein